MSLDDEIENPGSAGALALAFACGLLSGAAIALLITPTPGRDTRAWVAARGRSAGRATADLLTRNHLIAIVRHEGVRGLLHRLESRRKQGETAGQPNL